MFDFYSNAELIIPTIFPEVKNEFLLLIEDSSLLERWGIIDGFMGQFNYSLQNNEDYNHGYMKAFDKKLSLISK